MIEALCALRRGQLRDPAKLTQFVIAIARNVLNNHFEAKFGGPNRSNSRIICPIFRSLKKKRTNKSGKRWR